MNKITAGRGRPRSFDMEAGLDKAVLLFWSQGYEGTSIADLSGALGVTAPTIYSSFGSKEKLYRKALGRYREKYGIAQRIRDFNETDDVTDAFQNYLTASARALADDGTPPGCMVLSANLLAAPENKAALQMSDDLRRQAMQMFQDKLSRAKNEGQLSADADPRQLAAFVSAFAQGLSGLSTQSVSEEVMLSAVAVAVSAIDAVRSATPQRETTMGDTFASATQHHVGYAGSWLDRADDLRRDPTRLAKERSNPSARWLVMDELRPVMASDSELLWVQRDAVSGDASGVFLGLDGGEPRFAVAMNAGHLPGVIMEARHASTMLDAGSRPGAAAILAQARSLLAWHERNRFCANCGSPTVMDNGGYVRRCEVCGARHRPSTDPVAIMLPVHDDMALIARQPGFPRGIFSALAGFVEVGETFEDAVRRELKEEVGIETGRIRYVASQPWPFPSSLMIAALVEATSMEITIDARELEEARWVSKEEVRAALAEKTGWDGRMGSWSPPPPLAIAHTLLREWAGPYTA